MSSTSSTVPNGHPTIGSWVYVVAPYVVPAIAASAAIVPAFRDLIAKSAQQKGLPLPDVTLKVSVKQGIRAAPTVGAIVGMQMIMQRVVERVLYGESSSNSLVSTFASSAIVGTASAPVLAVFNGQTMGWTIRESLRKFTAKQAVAVAIQETAFVGGLSVADQLAVVMKQKFGDSKAVDYSAAFIAGAAGSLTGHPANTALTRWQSSMPVDNLRQLMWGCHRKARAIGLFSVVYKFGKETLNSTLQLPKLEDPQ